MNPRYQGPKLGFVLALLVGHGEAVGERARSVGSQPIEGGTFGLFECNAVLFKLGAHRLKVFLRPFNAAGAHARNSAYSSVEVQAVPGKENPELFACFCRFFEGKFPASVVAKASVVTEPPSNHNSLILLRLNSACSSKASR